MALTPAGPASLPPLARASRELMEVLWTAPRPLSTGAVHRAVASRYPARAGRAIQTTATLLTALMARGWVVGEKRRGTRWAYAPAVSRGEALEQLARRAVEEFCVEPSDGLYLLRAFLARLDEPTAAPARTPCHQPKSAAPEALSPPSFR